VTNLFALTKREQRVAVAIALLLLFGAMVRHYFFVRTHAVLPPAIKQPATSPIPSPPIDEGESSDDAG
jgi:hypothetical protein